MALNTSQSRAADAWAEPGAASTGAPSGRRTLRRRPGRPGKPDNRVTRYLVLVLLIGAAVLMLAPLVWAFSTSLRTPAQSFTLPPMWLPTDFAWENYRQVFEVSRFANYVTNNVVVSVAIVLGQLATASLAGYAFARLRFPGRGVLFGLVLATIMVPIQVTIVPIFILISEIGWADSLVALIVPAWPTAFGTFLLRQYFKTIPHELAEAAAIDGAGEWQIFFRVYLPLAKPGLAVVAILAFNFHWNEFFRPLIFLSSPEKFTLPLGLVNLQGYMGTGSISVVLAGIVISLLPVLALFIIAQRFVVEGLMRGGLKG
ncbi:carbohydrate ABC transporter permease [Phytoactinopolyspora mesophila]|uniref:ABC transporter permease subunit n=1 Tax=Phytoactinopolyspora mesophila TaxID=2650750 RepID=A0A7K3MCA1_9ACTN|nr:carbohydrate ABC transporter permease [Phytoactinopolyspora mesophila]NDL60592.1 ABC transporter permease subunit [Phytoactinopolyspora mesophila]